MKNTNTSAGASFRTLYAFSKKFPINLSLSENPLGCSPRVKRFMKTMPYEIAEYPDPLLTALKTAIAQKNNLSPANIFISNGSESIIKALPEIFKQGSVIIPKVTFPMFKIAAELSGMSVVLSEMTNDLAIDLTDVEKKIQAKTTLIILCNPNNPTGSILPKDKILAFAKKTSAHVMVDEAGIDFGGESVVSAVNTVNNLIVLKSFSKAYGLAGLRIGFCAANSKIIAALEARSQPFPVARVSIAIARIALSDAQFLKKTKIFMNKERLFLTAELKKRGFQVLPSKANTILVNVGKFCKNSTNFVAELNKRGVSVIDGKFFPDLTGEFIRINPQKRKINTQFLKVLDGVVKSQQIK